MKTKKQEMQDLFLQQKALKNLIKTNEDKIENVIDEIFKDLKEKIYEIKFTFVSYGHYENMRASVFKYEGNFKDIKMEIYIEDFKISGIDGREKSDKDFEKVIKIVEKFLEDLNKSDK